MGSTFTFMSNGLFGEGMERGRGRKGGGEVSNLLVFFFIFSTPHRIPYTWEVLNLLCTYTAPMMISCMKPSVVAGNSPHYVTTGVQKLYGHIILIILQLLQNCDSLSVDIATFPWP